MNSVPKISASVPNVGSNPSLSEQLVKLNNTYDLKIIIQNYPDHKELINVFINTVIRNGEKHPDKVKITLLAIISKLNDNIDLTKCDLTFLTTAKPRLLANATLTGAKLKESIFLELIFEEGRNDLSNIEVDGISIKKQVLSDLDLSRAKLSGTFDTVSFDKVCFEECDLENIKFSNCEFFECNFGGARYNKNTFDPKCEFNTDCIGI